MPLSNVQSFVQPLPLSFRLSSGWQPRLSTTPQRSTRITRAKPSCIRMTSTPAPEPSPESVDEPQDSPPEDPSLLPQMEVPDHIAKAFDAVIDNLEKDIEQRLLDDDQLTPSERRRLEHDRRQEELRQAHIRRLDVLTSLPSQFLVEKVPNKCSGCGAVLQSKTPSRAGYLPPHILEVQQPNDDATADSSPTTAKKNAKSDATENRICQRCYRLTHYGTIDPQLRVFTKNAVAVASRLSKPVLPDLPNADLTPAKFRKCLEQLQSTNAVVVYLVDIFDFHGSFIPSLRDIIGSNNPVILAVNKVDLLPRDHKPIRVEAWIRHECRALRMHNIDAVHFISSTKGFGVNVLLADAVRLARKRRANIYVVGAANVGKSSFINQLIRRRKSNGQRRAETTQMKLNDDTGEEVEKKKKKKGVDEDDALTTSVIPGTTLDVVKIPLGKNINLYDTPGLMVSHQLTNLLDEKDLRAVVPSKAVEKVTYRLSEGKALFIGGLARVEVISGRAFFFTCFFSAQVKIHPGRVEEAEDFTKTHLGQMLTPPSSTEGFERLGEWTTKSFSVDGDSWKKSSVDIVLSGLGWISVTGPGRVRVRVCLPKEVGVFTRDPLMPFEVQGGVSAYTGQHGVNRRQENRSRRRREERSERDSDKDLW